MAQEAPRMAAKLIHEAVSISFIALYVVECWCLSLLLEARKNTADYLFQPGGFVKRFFAFVLKTAMPALPGLHDQQVYQ
jgi:hypothetical protein